MFSSTNHIFEDYTFTTATLCSHCNKSIWTKSGRRCRICSIALHKKCEKEFDNEHICTRERNHSESKVPVHEYSIVSAEELDLMSNTLPTAAATPKFTTISKIGSTIEIAANTAISFIDSSAAQPIYGLLNKQLSVPSISILPSDKSPINALSKSLSSTDKRSLTNVPSHVSSTIANALILTYHKLISIKGKSIQFSLTAEPRIKRTRSDLSNKLFIVFFS